MTLGELAGIGLLGGVGAMGRFALDGAVGSRAAGAFPAGTLTVNLLGSLALGVCVGLVLHGERAAWLETGLIGGFTTFSTWMFEAQRLGEDRRTALGLLYIALSLGLGILAAWAGRHIGGAL
jgi:CrcB protein